MSRELDRRDFTVHRLTPGCPGCEFVKLFGASDR
jgi:hypothetical protein